MVMNGSPIDRQWLAAIFAEDDRQRAENARFAEELRQKAERTAYAQKSDPESGLIYRDQQDALVAAAVPAIVPSSASEGFSEHQRDVIAHLINALRAEWQQDIERLEQKILQTVVRLVQPGEHAEAKLYGLNDRIAIMEGKLERHLPEIAELKAENRKLKALLNTKKRES